jgi:hypothetical protein
MMDIVFFEWLICGKAYEVKLLIHEKYKAKYE